MENFNSQWDILYWQIASELNKTRKFECELYNPSCQYDSVIFTKMMNRECQKLARRLKQQNVKIVFDANVNYYKIWGDFIVDGTKPALEQQRDAVAMTQLELIWLYAVQPTLPILPQSIIKTHISLVITLTFDHFRYRKNHKEKDQIIIGWCGYAKKSLHISLIADVLKNLSEKYRIRLRIIAEDSEHYRNDFGIPFDWVPWNFDRFPEEIVQSDIAISPKYLNNSYDLGHSEYKIAVFMAEGIPAVVSPQQSYCEAIENGKSSFIASNEEEWYHYLESLIRDTSLRSIIGQTARERIKKLYSKEIVAQRYVHLIKSLF